MRGGFEKKEITIFFGDRVMEKLLTFNILTLTAISIVLCCFDHAVADISMSGTFDINPTSTPSFDPIPFLGSSMYVFPFAAPETDLYTGLGTTYNLGTLQLFNGSVFFADSSEKTGNLGIRISSAVSGDKIFQESILTLDFGGGIFNVYLPELAFSWSQDMFLWVAQSGATYYATALQGPGLPDMTASFAMSFGDANLARAPEPVTLALFGSGALILLGRRRRPSRVHRLTPQR